MLQTGDVRVSVLPGAGLLGGFYYDPYPPRFAANLKEALAVGALVLIRLHPGVRYPMSEAELLDTVDPEGHVVAVIGYSNDDATFELADPWSTERFGGEDGGARFVPELELGLRWVDSTYDKAMFVFPLHVDISVRALSDDLATISATTGIRPPAPSVRCAATALHDVHASLSVPHGIVLLDSPDQEISVVDGDRLHDFHWAIRFDGSPDGEIRLAVAAIARANDPYAFSDVVGSVASLDVREDVRSVVGPKMSAHRC